MCKWKSKFRQTKNNYNVSPVFVPSGKVEFTDCKVFGDIRKMLALMNNEVIHLHKE